MAVDVDEEFLYKDETYRIIGACMAVHRELGGRNRSLSIRKPWV